MKVRFTRPAQQDVLEIYDHVSQDNPEAASRIVARITELCWALSDNPYQGRKTDEPGALLLLVPRLNYFIFYSVEGNEVHILHIRHTARKRPRAWDVE